MQNLNNVIDEAINKGVSGEIIHQIRKRNMQAQGRDFELAAEMVEQATEQLSSVHDKFCKLLASLEKSYTPALAGLLEIHVRGLRRPLTRCYVTILGEEDEKVVEETVTAVIDDFLQQLREVRQNPAITANNAKAITGSDPTVLQIGKMPQNSSWTREELEAMPWAELRKISNAGATEKKSEIIERLLNGA